MARQPDEIWWWGGWGGVAAASRVVSREGAPPPAPWPPAPAAGSRSQACRLAQFPRAREARRPSAAPSCPRSGHRSRRAPYRSRPSAYRAPSTACPLPMADNASGSVGLFAVPVIARHCPCWPSLAPWRRRPSPMARTPSRARVNRREPACILGIPPACVHQTPKKCSLRVYFEFSEQ
jgi:hypothetical protein